MTILVKDSQLHVYKGPLPHETKSLLVLLYIFHNTKRLVANYKSDKRNVIKDPQEKCSVNFCVKTKEKLYS